MLLDIITTLLISTLSGMGIGSGGLMVLYLTQIRHAPQLAAQGFNLLFFLFASAASMIVHLLRRRILWGAVALMILFGLPAAYLGTRVAVSLPEGWMPRIFGLFLVAVGIPGVFGTKWQKKLQKT